MLSDKLGEASSDYDYQQAHSAAELAPRWSGRPFGASALARCQ
jgi:hypothetical protein